ncbi:MAG TPA: 16S rRNA (guanine(527)-N(7))-methyltransferase RsmG [Nitrospirota bacterium]|nr:16S rRNA (guanine(527)-N(7))-methyltransferase RsmG [Nitrospirota bacterium]
MTLRELLTTGAHALGVALTVEQSNSILMYIAELKKWNRKINLTAITDDREMVIKHILDSLSYGMGFASTVGLKLLDIGSGAGFPAIPLKLTRPEITVTMVESTKKKASFLRHIIRMLKLSGVNVVDKRTEDITDLFMTFDVVTARAFADMNTALDAGTPFLKRGGLIVLSRGPEESLEEQQRDRAGVILEMRIPLTLPHSDYKRVLWIFKKTG